MKILKLICFVSVSVQIIVSAEIPPSLEKYSKVSFNLGYSSDCQELDCIRLEVTNESGEELLINENLIKRSLIVTFLIRYENHQGEVRSKGFSMSHPINTSSYNHTHSAEHGSGNHHHHHESRHLYSLETSGNIQVDFLQLMKSTLDRFKKDMPSDFKKIDSIRVLCLLRNPFDEIQQSDGVKMDYTTKGFELPLDKIKRALVSETLF